ncbi:hypothetical protein PanWU01x14_245060, partial [Parasponia andersonii]
MTSDSENLVGNSRFMWNFWRDTEVASGAKTTRDRQWQLCQREFFRAGQHI